MKSGQLVDYNTGNIFVEKSYTKCCGETRSRFFFKKSKSSISQVRYFVVLCSLFLLYTKLRAIEI